VRMRTKVRTDGGRVKSSERDDLIQCATLLYVFVGKSELVEVLETVGND
jgi:hypothetical protein